MKEALRNERKSSYRKDTLHEKGDTISQKKDIVHGTLHWFVFGPIFYLIFISDIGKSSITIAWIYVVDNKLSKEVNNLDQATNY